MNKTSNSYYNTITILFCTLNVISLLISDQVGAHFRYKGKYTTDITNYEIVVPQRVNKDGSVISHIISHQPSKRSTKEMELIFYKIPIAGKDYLIELTPNIKLISPGAVVEIHNTNSMNLDKSNSTNEEVGKMFQNLNMKTLKNTGCHFSGHVRGENLSKAALSTCHGLAGFIQIDKGFYTIEPVAEHDSLHDDVLPHILYKSNGLENNSFCQTIGKLKAIVEDQMARRRRESNIGPSTPLYIETLIVMDKSLIDYHKQSDCENYVLTVFNMASNLFHDASLGLLMTLTIVRIIRLEVDTVEINLKKNADAKRTLENFQTWQYEINPGDDTHPNHHDVAVLITRVDVCSSPSACGLLGLSTVGKACDPKLSVALCEDNGLRLGFLIAHEIGHLLGADHDSVNSSCKGIDPDGLKTVMHPEVSLNSQTWSKCSQAHFKAFFKSGMGNCFLDEPEEHHFNFPDLLPGVMYNADFQCKHLIALDARECDMGSTCDSLNCYVPGYACIVTHSPPADGTRCDENMWCHEGKCISIGQRPGAIDGNWGEWSPWSDCSRTCGSGVSNSVRQCDKPKPSHGGKNCVGERKRYKVCSTTPCKTGRPSFRDVQCGEFNDWIYPEDGKTHTWEEYYLHDDNPCILYCINENKQVAALTPRVVDGTMCYRGIRDICVGGVCKSLPCDLHFESEAVEDVCGVCHGDGTGCEFTTGMETYTHSTKSMIRLINIPGGTRNIRVEEMSASQARIVVKDKDTKDVYIKGQDLGMFNVPGSQAWLGMIKKSQEALSIPGPVSKPLSIWIQKPVNVTIKWSMALPPSQQRKPEFAWDFLQWGPCSAKCGPGTQKSVPNCMEEKSGLVENSFCADLEIPPTKVRPCEITKCKPRWMVGDWKECIQVNAKKIRKRVVYCIKQIGEGEGESQIISNSECPKPKPHDTEPCENRRKREDNNDQSYFDESMYRSNTGEFGIHKKYDDYLTHFAALSGPQRKSETIPVHLVSSPHFKHYFRVLETPEDYSDVTDLNGSNLFKKKESLIGKNGNLVSPDFYKNTFSGTPVDVSPVKTSLKTRRKSTQRKQENKNKGRYKWGVVEGKKKIAMSQLIIKHKSNAFKFSRKKRNIKNAKKLKFWKFQNNNFQTVNAFENPQNEVMRQNVYMLTEKQVLPTSHTLVHQKYTPQRCKKNDRCSSLEFLSCLPVNNIEEKIKSHQKAPWSFGMEKSDSFDGCRNNRCKTYLASLKELNEENEESYDLKKQIKNLKHLKKQYDGSGLKRVDFSETILNDMTHDLKLILEYNRKEWENERDKKFKEMKQKYSGSKGLWIHKFLLPKRNLVSICRESDYLIPVANKKLRANFQRKRNTPYVLNRLGSNKVSLAENGPQPWDHHLRKAVKKRLSRKWKKQKPKESHIRNNKDVAGSVCGTETKNYLNNLFRDPHLKVMTKPEPKVEEEKTVINTGHLVIDRDFAKEQQVEIVPEDDDSYRGKLSRINSDLPYPSKTQTKLSLRGPEVFDLFRKLQRRNQRLVSKLNGAGNDKSEDKIEIDVKIPSSSPDERNKTAVSNKAECTTQTEAVVDLKPTKTASELSASVTTKSNNETVTAVTDTTTMESKASSTSTLSETSNTNLNDTQNLCNTPKNPCTVDSNSTKAPNSNYSTTSNDYDTIDSITSSTKPTCSTKKPDNEKAKNSKADDRNKGGKEKEKEKENREELSRQDGNNEEDDEEDDEKEEEMCDDDENPSVNAGSFNKTDKKNKQSKKDGIRRRRFFSFF